MKRPVRFSSGRLEYTGGIDRAAFLAWAQSADGRAVLEPITSRVRFAMFGRHRVAQRDVWRQLTQAARSDTVAGALQRDLDSYLAHLDSLAYARDLPRVGVDLRRLVVIPRLFANAAVERCMDASLDSQHVFVTLEEGRRLRGWFILSLVEAVEAAMVNARPSLKNPVAIGDDWILVGVNDRFEWHVPLEGPAWPGHYYLLELTRIPISRGIRKAAAEAILDMESSLPSLSRAHRSEIVRQAGLSLQQLAVRA